MKQITRRSFLIGLSAASVSAHSALASVAHPRLMFAGTETSGKSASKGIYAYRWDPVSGALTSIGLAAETASPMFLAHSPDRSYLYAVNEIRDYKGAKDGSVSAFSVNQATGMLTSKNVISSGGAGPASIAVDHTGKVVFVADGFGGSLASYRVLRDGSLSDPVSNFHFPGHGPNPTRQATAYTHCTTLSPDNRYVVVNDLGLDRITAFRFDPDTAVITPNNSVFYHGDPGSGPRSLTFHPNHRWAYSLNEIASTLDALAWDKQRGLLTRFQNLPTTAPEYSGQNLPAALQVDRTGRFLYLSNRGANTIGVWSIDQTHGTLVQIQQISSGGISPRHFTLDPTEHWLLAANHENITILERNSQTGLLTSSNSNYKLDSPVCLIFA